MAKLPEILVQQFDGGIKNEPRDSSENTARVVSNFDILTNPKKMTPYFDGVPGDTVASTSQKQNFVIALRTGTTYRIYSLGVQSGTSKAEILMKDITTGGSSDLSDNGWLTPTNNQSTQPGVNFNLFVYYKKTGLIYGAENRNTIFTFDPSSVASFSSASQPLTYTNIAQGLVHSKDDILYIPYDNNIATNNSGGWNNTALTINSFHRINSICEYGNYLAIGAQDISGTGNSAVLLWDRNSSYNNISEKIDWGTGQLKVLEQIGNDLIGISIDGGVSYRKKDKIIIRRYLGGNKTEVIETLIASNSSSVLPIAKQKIDDRLYFLLSMNLAGSVREGLWSVGYSQSGRLTVVHERTPNNDTALGNGTLKGFFIIGDYVFISSQNNSSTFQLIKTNSANSYTATSIYETKIFNNGSSRLIKKLLGAAVMTEPLPLDAQVVLKFKKDSDTSWTTIFTNSTPNSIQNSGVRDASGNNLPEYKEIQFRIESTGGAEITGFSFRPDEELFDKVTY